MTRSIAFLSLFLATLSSCNPPPPSTQGIPPDEAVIPKRPLVVRAGKPVADLPGERHFKNVRKLTSGGENAEAYWSNDGRKLIFQSTRPPHECDQIYVLDLESEAPPRMVSTGKGVTTCAYFTLDDKKIVYASTHAFDEKCPPPVMIVKGRYVWAVREGYDLFRCNLDGTGLEQLTKSPRYDAEATVCPVTGRIVFTSARSNDLEVWSMEQDGTDLKQLTSHVGYDGGPFYSHDGSKIVYRCAVFDSPAEESAAVKLLEQNVVEPKHLEIMVMDRDGKNPRQITSNGKANFAPYFTPDDKAIVFASNVDEQNPRGRNFEIYRIGLDGKGQERITNNLTFDAFPMFSPDGKHFVFASNRHGDTEGETNIFICEWVD